MADAKKIKVNKNTTVSMKDEQARKGIGQINTSLYDQEFLGWTVPSECPIKNYVDGNGDFHQRVDRVRLKDLSWQATTYNRFISSPITNAKSPTSTSEYANIYNVKYKNAPKMVVEQKDMQIALDPVKTVYICNKNVSSAEALVGTFTDGDYVYFELDEEVVIKVGNEAVSKINDSLYQQVEMLASGYSIAGDGSFEVNTYSDIFIAKVASGSKIKTSGDVLGFYTSKPNTTYKTYNNSRTIASDATVPDGVSWVGIRQPRSSGVSATIQMLDVPDVVADIKADLTKQIITVTSVDTSKIEITSQNCYRVGNHYFYNIVMQTKTSMSGYSPTNVVNLGVDFGSNTGSIFAYNRTKNEIIGGYINYAALAMFASWNSGDTIRTSFDFVV